MNIKGNRGFAFRFLCYLLFKMDGYSDTSVSHLPHVATRQRVLNNQIMAARSPAFNARLKRT